MANAVEVIHMQSYYRLVKQLVGLVASSVYSWIGSDRSSCLTLTYHRVTDAPDPADSLCVSRSVFREQMAFLKRNYTALSGDEFTAILTKRRPFPPKACLITFDDGWHDNYVNAFPILREQGLPAVIFLATDFIGTGAIFWHEKLQKTLSRESWTSESTRLAKLRGKVDESILSCLDRISSKTSDDRRCAIYDLIEFLKGKMPGERDEICTMIEDAVGMPQLDHAPIMLSWDAVRQMSRGQISFGAHTKSHPILTQIPLTDVRVEVEGAKTVIEREIGRPVTLFCYPNGNYNREIAVLVQEAGYTAAFTCIPGHNRICDPPFELKRINVVEEMSVDLWGRFSARFFSAEVSGARVKLRAFLMSHRHGSAKAYL